MEDAYRIGMAAIVVNGDVDDLQGYLLVPEQETECEAAFSLDVGGRVLRESCRCRRLLLSIVHASHFFPFI